MTGTAPRRLSGVLEDLLRGLGLEERMAAWRAVALWPEVVGGEAARRTEAVSCSGGTLFVQVSSNAWMHQLSFLRQDIRNRLNHRLGREVVREIVFTLRKERESP
jgi:predicted nucleic acid-binding Zn ribbon protein